MFYIALVQNGDKLKQIIANEQTEQLNKCLYRGIELMHCLYWGDSSEQVYGQSAHHFSRDGLVHAVVLAEFLHTDENSSDTRAPSLATDAGARVVQTGF